MVCGSSSYRINVYFNILTQSFLCVLCIPFFPTHSFARYSHWMTAMPSFLIFHFYLCVFMSVVDSFFHFSFVVITAPSNSYHSQLYRLDVLNLRNKLVRFNYVHEYPPVLNWENERNYFGNIQLPTAYTRIHVFIVLFTNFKWHSSYHIHDPMHNNVDSLFIIIIIWKYVLLFVLPFVHSRCSDARIWLPKYYSRLFPFHFRSIISLDNDSLFSIDINILE